MEKQQINQGSTPVKAEKEATSPLQGYVPFPAELRTGDHLAAGADATTRGKRSAVLVLHGIGTQKPYETLDQFARGLLGFFRSPKPPALPTQEVRLRQHKANLNTNQQDWTQAFVRVCPNRPSHDVIDVYEYYWAPVITDRVSALQSLRFLISAGLSPFQYLRDNLIVINRAHAEASRTNKAGWLFFSLCRELYRMLFIFIPAIAAALGLYWLLATSITKLFARSDHSLLSYFLLKPLTPWTAVVLGLFAIRILILGMCAIFLFQEFFSSLGGGRGEKSPPMYVGCIASLFLALTIAPHFLGGYLQTGASVVLHLSLLTYGVLLLLLVALSFSSKILRSAWKRAWKAIMRHVLLFIVALLALSTFLTLLWIFGLHHLSQLVKDFLALPNSINWHGVFFYSLLALSIYIAKRVLTTAIGCLAVYLGADDLSKNFAARSQILHECTAMLIDLLAGRDETGQPNGEWTYDQVLVAAHSLGSVIAYDSLNQLILRNLARDPLLNGVPLEKIKGLLTFGCPLNKVVYFFRSRTNLRTSVLSQILYLLHPFRLSTPLPPEANPAIALPHPFPQRVPFSPDFRWFNAYSPFDIVSGRMQFYIADADIPVEKGVAPWTAHLSYWENDDLYSLFSHLL